MAQSNEQRIERILKKLSLVRQKRLSCFGADSHGYRLNAPLEESDLVLFESTYGVILPADYRCFLKMAGNGGAGPYYGIYTLDKSSTFLDWVLDDPRDDLLRLPCPFHPKMCRASDWEAQFTGCVSPYQGLISIGTQGCTYETGLIVTGEYAGRVVYLDADGQAPYVVREPDFLAWYERWLDELLGGYDMFAFGYGLGGDETSLAALLDAPSTPDDERAEAIHAMWRLPSLSTDVRTRMCQLVRDEFPEVRAAACRIVEKFEIVEAVEALPGLLHDTSPDVQRAAISATTKLRGEADTCEVTRLLDSDDAEVAVQAFLDLSKHGRLPRDVLFRLVQSSPHGSIRYWAAHAVEWKAEDEQLLIRLLKDEHPQVRFYATLGLRQITSRLALDAAIDLLGHETNEHTKDSILRMLGDVPGERNVGVLLEWTKSQDDFYRLTAVESLCRLGDIRAQPVAEAMLKENRQPVRVDASGFPMMSHLKSIRDLVRESLRASPNRRLRRMTSRFRWPW